MQAQDKMKIKEEARSILQELVKHTGWITCGDGVRECVFCGAFESDHLSSTYHRTGCIVERAKECASKLLMEEK